MGLPDRGTEDDDTIRLPRGPVSRRGRRVFGLAAGACLLVVVAGLGGLWYGSQRPDVQPAARTAPAYPIALADEAAILANQAGDPAILRFSANPAVLVLDFAGLHQQGAMLNRVAALIEKAGLPRDRVLDDTELARAITASGSTADTYYYGHDYRAADLARFFTLAGQENVALSAQEIWLRGLLAQEHWLQPGATGALLSLPRDSRDSGGAPGLDVAGLATILRHELSHGEYFTSPAYADWTRRFWQTVLGPPERSLFRQFLAGEGYDPQQEDLMMNEAQAYLMHTADRRFFSAAALGATPAQVVQMRQAFLQGMPAGWLRDVTPAPPTGAGETAAAPAPRRRQPTRRSGGGFRPTAAPARIRRSGLRRGVQQHGAA